LPSEQGSDDELSCKPQKDAPCRFTPSERHRALSEALRNLFGLVAEMLLETVSIVADICMAPIVAAQGSSKNPLPNNESSGEI
jgi:hypothetical protein